MLRHSVDPLGALSSPSESLTVTSTHMPYCHASVLLVLGGTFLTFPGASTALCLERIVTAALASTIKCREKSTLAHNRLHRPPKQGRDFPTTLAIPMISLSRFDDQYIKSDPSIMNLSYPSLFSQWISLINLIMLGPLALVGYLEPQ